MLSENEHQPNLRHIMYSIIRLNVGIKFVALYLTGKLSLVKYSWILEDKCS